MTVSSYTLNFRLRKILYDSRNYHLDEWSNLDVIDGILATLGSATPFVGVPGGTGDAITLDYTPNISYSTGQLISFVVGAVNTGAVTVNADGLGAKALKTAGGAALVAAQLQVGMYVKAIYNGTDFTLIQPAYSAITTPYVSTGPSGATPEVSSDDFYVENSANVGVSLLNPAGFIGRLTFGRPLAPTAGSIKYDHADDSFSLRLNSVEKVGISSAGVLDVGGTGYMKNTATPGFSAYKTYGAAGTMPTTGTPWIFPTELFDNGSCYNEATGVFTAQVAGMYYFFFDPQAQTAGSTNTPNLQFYKNGVAVGYSRTGSFGSSRNGVNLQLQILIQLAVNDTIDVRCTLTSAVTEMGGSFSGLLVG